MCWYDVRSLNGSSAYRVTSLFMYKTLQIRLPRGGRFSANCAYHGHCGPIQCKFSVYIYSIMISARYFMHIHWFKVYLNRNQCDAKFAHVCKTFRPLLPVPLLWLFKPENMSVSRCLTCIVIIKMSIMVNILIIKNSRSFPLVKSWFRLCWCVCIFRSIIKLANSQWFILVISAEIN